MPCLKVQAWELDSFPFTLTPNAMLIAFPTAVLRGSDSRLEEALFVRQREGAGAQKQQLARLAAAKAATGGACYDKVEVLVAPCFDAAPHPCVSPCCPVALLPC